MPSDLADDIPNNPLPEAFTVDSVQVLLSEISDLLTILSCELELAIYQENILTRPDLEYLLQTTNLMAQKLKIYRKTA